MRGSDLTTEARRHRDMSELTERDLNWFRLANSAAPDGFYDFKRRFLARFATRDGWDLQTIEKECWTCDGSGKYAKDVQCRSCDGSGIHHTAEHWLQRWNLCGQIYHVPEFCAPPHWQRGDSQKNEIHGRIAHAEVSPSAARRAYLRLLLRHEPMNFYWAVINRMKWRGQEFKAKWHWRLLKLRNKMGLFPVVDEIPF